jgi:hypothetical protein
MQTCFDAHKLDYQLLYICSKRRLSETAWISYAVTILLEME